MVNVMASELLKFQDRFPDYVEIFVTDQYGALVAMTNRTSHYYQADEPWWQAAYNGGQGAVYIGNPEYDESNVTYSLKIAIPIYGGNERNVIGILHTTYNLASLKKLLERVELGETGHMDLLLPEGQILALDGAKLEPVSPATLNRLQASAAANYSEIFYEGAPSLVSQAPVEAATGEQIITNLGWRVIVHQERQEALATVQDQQNVILLLTLGIAGVTVIVAVVVAQVLVRPISRLTEVAQQVAVGNLSARAQAKTSDEIGLLAKTFNAMTQRLQETVDTLEERVVERTRQLETVVQISQRLTGILDLSDLLRQVVNLTKETFDYYHVHIYLMDEKGESLLMTAGYGEAGAEMKVQGHSIPITAPKSLVARAAREGVVITVENVRLDSDWLPNPLLPHTYSEMAVPVMLGAQVVGVLDVQSKEIGGLTHEDEVALRALANQVATAVRNARLFSETQEALYEAQRLQQLYTGQAWEKLGATRTLDYEYRQSNLPPLTVTPIPEAIAALQQKRTVDLRTPSSALEPRENEEPRSEIFSTSEAQSGQTPAHTALATPLKLRDQVIGVLGIHCDDPQRRWTEDEIALIEAVSEQMSLAIENARLFEETGRRAGRERLIADVTQQVWASGELERVMQTAVEQLGAKLDASKVIIRLGVGDDLVKDQ
jgi:GAF domain-containing protein/HAMP domain-containing protein